MHARFRDTENPDNDRVPHIGHRIDKEPSGVLLFAFSEKWKADVSTQFEQRTVRKQYEALVHGHMSAPEGEVDAPILHRREGWPRLIVNDAGLPSRTSWRVEEKFAHASLVRFFPHTGRTHQIRVHAAHLGHPLLCDSTYGGQRPTYASGLRGVPDDERPEGEQPILERVALHSARLEIAHPVSGERFAVEAPLPADLRAAADAMRAAS
jgi:RluA family pseudouridine synthase